MPRSLRVTKLTRSSRAIAATAGLIAALALSGCHASVSVGKLSVSSPTVEKKIIDSLEAKTGERAKSVDCPDSLDGKVGATVRCTLTANSGATVGVTATVDTVKDKNVHFDIQVDTTVTPAPTGS